MKSDEALRIAGSLLVIVGWTIVLNTSATIGAATSAAGDTLALPYFMRTRAWDVVAMIAVLHSVTLAKLAQGLVS